jgi:hypothetical protein
MSKSEWFKFKGTSIPFDRLREIAGLGGARRRPEETLYGDTADPDTRAMAQAAPIPSPRPAKGAGRARRAVPSVRNRATNAPPSPTATLPVPAYRDHVPGVIDKNWNEWSGAVGRLSKLHSAEKRAYMDIFAAEGGNEYDPRGRAMSGIQDRTLRALIDRKYVKGIKRGTDLRNLTFDQRAMIYRNYFDFAMNQVGGSAAFGRLGDAEAASAVADTLFRNGRTGGGKMIREAINKVTPGTLTIRGATGNALPFNETALAAFRKIVADPAKRQGFLDALADIRIKDSPREAPRYDYYRFQKSP